MTVTRIVQAGSCLVAFLLAPPVQAQGELTRAAPPQEQTPAIRSYPLRVDSAMNINIPSGASANTEEQVKQIATTRSYLYQAAAQECDNLRAAFKADCRLLNVRVSSNIQPRGVAGDVISVTVSTSYEVTIRPN